MTTDERRALFDNSATVIDLVEIYGTNLSGNALYNSSIQGIPLANSPVEVVYNGIGYAPSSFSIPFIPRTLDSLHNAGNITISGINPLIYSAMVKSTTELELLHTQIFYKHSDQTFSFWRKAMHKVMQCSNDNYTTSLSTVFHDGLYTEIGKLKFTSSMFPGIFK